MVVSAQRLASEVGAEILRQGGNAVDAAVATAYALAVVEPCCGNLGGGGFMTIHLADGRDRFINFRERAPLAATPGMFLDAQGNVVPGRSTKGYLAVGVPGTVAGLERARERYGTMDRARLMAPAIRLAEQGFTLTDADAAILGIAASRVAGEANAAAIFLDHGQPLRAGDRLVQHDLARSLRRIAADGADGFYHGPIAAAIAAASAANGGILTTADFAAYRVEELAPLTCSYRGYTIVSAPPPSSGGVTLCEILGVLAAYPLAQWGWHSAAAVHVVAEAERHAYIDRNGTLGDPDVVRDPIAALLAPAHAAAIRAAILPDRATPSAAIAPLDPPREGTETTHFSVLDGKGEAVALTFTINNYFGAGVIAGDTGFFLNDEMDDFTAKPGSANIYGLVQGAANLPGPGKRPLSSMTPTVVLRDGKVALVLGSPGGSRIITSVLETILGVVDYGMTIGEAVDAPRLHEQAEPDALFAERFALSPDTAAMLRAMGYAIVEQNVWGAVEAIEAGPAAGTSTLGNPGDDTRHGGVLEPGMVYGANDARRPAGAAIGE